MLDVYSIWQETHASPEEADIRALCAAKADYVARALEAGVQAIELLPRPA
jgi:hypothetical protein